MKIKSALLAFLLAQTIGTSANATIGQLLYDAFANQLIWSDFDESVGQPTALRFTRPINSGEAPDLIHAVTDSQGNLGVLFTDLTTGAILHFDRITPTGVTLQSLALTNGPIPLYPTGFDAQDRLVRASFSNPGSYDIVRTEVVTGSGQIVSSCSVAQTGWIDPGHKPILQNHLYYLRMDPGTFTQSLRHLDLFTCVETAVMVNLPAAQSLEFKLINVSGFLVVVADMPQAYGQFFIFALAPNPIYLGLSGNGYYTPMVSTAAGRIIGMRELRGFSNAPDLLGFDFPHQTAFAHYYSPGSSVLTR